jgi:hypothetical protein
VRHKLLDFSAWCNRTKPLCSDLKRVKEAVSVLGIELRDETRLQWRGGAQPIQKLVEAKLKDINKLGASRRNRKLVLYGSLTYAAEAELFGKAAAAAAKAAAKVSAAAAAAAPAVWEQGRVEVEMKLDPKDTQRRTQLGADSVLWFNDDLKGDPINLGHVPDHEDDATVADPDTARLTPAELFKSSTSSCARGARGTARLAACRT